MNTRQIGTVAVQQALRHWFGRTYKDIGLMCGIHPRTAWQHVAARPGSLVTPWENRTQWQRDRAVAVAFAMVANKWTISEALADNREQSAKILAVNPQLAKE